MKETAVTYQITDHQSGATIISTLDLEGWLVVIVHLLKSRNDFLWKAHLPPSSLMACRDAIYQLQQLPKSFVTNASFSVTETSSTSPREVASWNLSQESINHAKTRELLESRIHTLFVIALAYQQAGKAASQMHNEQTSGLAYKEGVEALGNTYRDEKNLDDTGLKLVLARNMEAKEGLAKAAPVYERILESRTAIYADREGLKSDGAHQ